MNYLRSFAFLSCFLFAIVGCSKKETPKSTSTYTVEIIDLNPLRGDSIFFGYDYWFYDPARPAAEIYKTGVNSKFSGKGYASESLSDTKREYLGTAHKHSQDYEIAPGSGLRFAYSLLGYRKNKEAKTWEISTSANHVKTINLYKNGEKIFTESGVGERSSNMELQPSNGR